MNLPRTHRADGARAWFDRQLNVRSWPGRGLSPLNIFIIVLIFVSAVLFAIETEATWRLSRWPALVVLNTGILVIFAIEFCLRIWSAGAAVGVSGFSARIRYAEPRWLAVDFIAFAPELAISLYLAISGDTAAIWVETIKLVRLLRIVKLAHYIPGAGILLDTIASVRNELFASVSIAAGLIFLSAVLMFFAEGASNPEAFGSVPRALWWSVVTLTTVGYGDVFPQTIAGRIAAGMVAVVGVGLVALPSGIVAGAFIERLRRERDRERAPDDSISE